MPIPKHIFQTWYTKDFSPEVQGIIDRMKQMNPHYQYNIYTDEEMDNFVKEHYPGQIYDCYCKINMIVAKADFWRYLALYKYGGVYIDIDSSIDVPLDSFINSGDCAILSSECGRETFTQWALIFDVNHPILRRTIQFIVDNITHNRYPDNVFHMTGPVVFTQAIKSIHREYFDKDIYVTGISGDYDETFTHCSDSYRILGNDYRSYFSYKHDYTHLLYNNKPHWGTGKQQVLNC